MRIAALYDIHGNLPALEAVLDEVRIAGVDRVLIGGDVIPGPMPAACLELLRELALPTDFIRGNGDREVLERQTGHASTTLPESVEQVLRWTGERLSAEQREWIASWPATVRLRVEGLGDVLFCHATPRDDNEIFTRRTPTAPLAPIFDAADATLVVCGHTHMQFDRVIGATRVVNAGSVGMPFGKPGAYWALVGPEVELRRTEPDLASVADRIRQSGYPEADSFARDNVVRPPSEDDMTTRLEALALG